MIAALLLAALSSVRLDGHDVCLDSAEARLVVSRLEDRLCRLRHDNDSAALVAADTAFAKTKQALDLCRLSLRQTDSLRNIPGPRKETSFLVSFGSGFATALVLILLWVLR